MRWLLVILGVVLSAAACPDKCTCHHERGLYVASCADIPSNPGRVEVLNILPTQQRLNPLELTDGQFNQARHLKYLNLRNHSLYFIHKKAFYGARNIIEIDLSFNYIEDLDPMLFQHLTSLTTLKLRGNPIQLEPEVPFVISNSIQHLDIGECKLKSVPRGVFYGLKRLRYLSMDGNHLKTLKYNSLPKGLNYINLSKNFIVNVPSEALSSLTNLRKINLGRNPVNCSCLLMNLQDWLSGKGVIFEESIICASPPEYSGISSSKVDENRLCLIEARTDEVSHSAHIKLSKSKLNYKKHFEHENSYSEEDFQADQPSLHPDVQVLFKNNETISMGEMMRDEEAVDNTELPEIKTKNNEAEDFKNKETKKETSLENENKGNETSANLELNDNLVGNTENINENKDKESDNPDITKPMETSNKETGENSNSTLFTDSETETFSVSSEPDQPKIENGTIDINSTLTVNLNGNFTTDYKHLNEEEPTGENDELKNEGFIVGEDSKYNVHLKNTFEEDTTDIPEITSEIEMASTDESPTIDIEETSKNEGSVNISLSSPEPTNGTIENTTKVEVSEVIPSPSKLPELFETNGNSNNSETIGHLGGIENEPSVNPENKSLKDVSSSNNPIEQRIKEVQGAEVLMFCLGVLVICLLLYSVYKCRLSSNKRSNSRTAKDMESNRGTELQDMASLIPKPADEDKKNHLKYPEKGTSSENVRLITEQNENEVPNKKVMDDNKTKKEEKNSLNNNTSSPTSKTPLLKPETPVTINPTEPIQRTRVKVGIIPDSIPRTPIFVQKTYNNGTKHV